MKRISYATWLVEGPAGRILVRRLAHQNWLVGHINRPLIPRFFTQKFRTKAQAVAFAKDMAAVNKRAAQLNPKTAPECQPSAP